MTRAGTAGKLRVDAARNRERLLAAADRVFAERGLDAGVDEVAREAGVGIGTLYRRFETKSDLIDALVETAMRQIVDIARDAATTPGGRGLEAYLEAASAFQAAHRGCLAGLWTYHRDRQLAAELRAVVKRLLEEAKRHGRVRDEVTETDITMLLWSMRGVIETTGDAAPNAWRRHLTILLAGLRPAQPELGARPLTRAQVQRVIRGT
ncbi:MAG TPA: helix-turn-helix domain-containing protein [Mycobacteriales bacterium]|nr:helix-turn-helix domain-containing protein [Mycobacteriales bacterium]